MYAIIRTSYVCAFYLGYVAAWLSAFPGTFYLKNIILVIFLFKCSYRQGHFWWLESGRTFAAKYLSYLINEN